MLFDTQYVTVGQTLAKTLFLAIFMVLDNVLAYSDTLGIKKHVLKLGNSMVAPDKSFEPNQNKTLQP